MTGTATDLLDLVARWVHVIAGIMWVGNSLLFNWLDRNLVAHPDQTQPPSLRTGGQQSIWLLHSGGFYFVEKTLLPGQKLPVPMHWFKWQAYTTWLSGFALLVIVYWVGGRAPMASTAMSDSSHGFATFMAFIAIADGWLFYEACNRLVAPHRPRLAVTLWTASLALIAFGLIRILDGRAAYLHVGAMLGTIMAGNVFFTIVPSQRKLVASVVTGEQNAAASDSARAKRVSIHNNYLTFPVIGLMVSSHFPTLYVGSHAWLKLMVIVAGGALVRLILNVRYTTRGWQPMLGATMLGTVAALYALSIQPVEVTQVTSDTGPAFTEVRRVIDRRCAACHSLTPSDLSWGAAPAGVVFDTPDQIMNRANRIHERAVVLRTMPPANKTHMTDAERDLIARWFAQGAVIR